MSFEFIPYRHSRPITSNPDPEFIDLPSVRAEQIHYCFHLPSRITQSPPESPIRGGILFRQIQHICNQLFQQLTEKQLLSMPALLRLGINTSWGSDSVMICVNIYPDLNSNLVAGELIDPTAIWEWFKGEFEGRAARRHDIQGLTGLVSEEGIDRSPWVSTNTEESAAPITREILERALRSAEARDQRLRDATNEMFSNHQQNHHTPAMYANECPWCEGQAYHERPPDSFYDEQRTRRDFDPELTVDQSGVRFSEISEQGERELEEWDKILKNAAEN